MSKPKSKVSAPGAGRSRKVAATGGKKATAKKTVKAAAGFGPVSNKTKSHAKPKEVAPSSAPKPTAPAKTKKKAAKDKSGKTDNFSPKIKQKHKPSAGVAALKSSASPEHVLFCLMRKKREGESFPRFLVVKKNKKMTFPCTEMTEGEDLFECLRRPLIEELGLPKDSYFPETELDMIRGYQGGPGGSGRRDLQYLYPIEVSLTDEAWDRIPKTAKWWTLEEVVAKSDDHNVVNIATYLRETSHELLGPLFPEPTMNALASHWAAHNRSGVRVLRDPQLKKILDVGDRAFNLRVVDPYLPYQKQGLGFTWSFFTPKDKQDVHVHGMPMVEIYGVLKGTLQIWYKFINQRGAQVWKRVTLTKGDWAEIEPLHCHLAVWLEPDGLGTVFRAGGLSSLAGVGKVGVSGKTTCEEEQCYKTGQCLRHPLMKHLADQYQRPFEARDYSLIAQWGQA